jgi:hypothetical protein
MSFSFAIAVVQQSAEKIKTQRKAAIAREVLISYSMDKDV